MTERVVFDGIPESFLLSTDAEENTNFDDKSDLNISESAKGDDSTTVEKLKIVTGAGEVMTRNTIDNMNAVHATTSSTTSFNARDISPLVSYLQNNGGSNQKDANDNKTEQVHSGITTSHKIGSSAVAVDAKTDVSIGDINNKSNSTNNDITVAVKNSRIKVEKTNMISNSVHVKDDIFHCKNDININLLNYIDDFHKRKNSPRRQNEIDNKNKMLTGSDLAEKECLHTIIDNEEKENVSSVLLGHELNSTSIGEKGSVVIPRDDMHANRRGKFIIEKIDVPNRHEGNNLRSALEFSSSSNSDTGNSDVLNNFYDAKKNNPLIATKKNHFYNSKINGRRTHSLIPRYSKSHQVNNSATSSNELDLNNAQISFAKSKNVHTMNGGLIQSGRLGRENCRHRDIDRYDEGSEERIQIKRSVQDHEGNRGNDYSNNTNTKYNKAVHKSERKRQTKSLELLNWFEDLGIDVGDDMKSSFIKDDVLSFNCSFFICHIVAHLEIIYSWKSVKNESGNESVSSAVRDKSNKDSVRTDRSGDAHRDEKVRGKHTNADRGSVEYGNDRNPSDEEINTDSKRKLKIIKHSDGTQPPVDCYSNSQKSALRESLLGIADRTSSRTLRRNCLCESVVNAIAGGDSAAVISLLSSLRKAYSLKGQNLV